MGTAESHLGVLLRAGTAPRYRTCATNEGGIKSGNCCCRRWRYGGAPAAKALDEIADVVLIDPKDAFVHNIAALRGLVNPEWTDRVFYPYERLLRRGRVVRDQFSRECSNV